MLPVVGYDAEICLIVIVFGFPLGGVHSLVSAFSMILSTFCAQPPGARNPVPPPFKQSFAGVVDGECLILYNREIASACACNQMPVQPRSLSIDRLNLCNNNCDDEVRRFEGRCLPVVAAHKVLVCSWVRIYGARGH